MNYLLKILKFGPRFNTDGLANSIFADAASAASAVLNGGTTTDTGSGGAETTKESTPVIPQKDVEPKAQPVDSPAAPSGEKAVKDATNDKPAEDGTKVEGEKQTAEEKPISSTAAAELRKFGEEWKARATGAEKRVTEELDPLIQNIEETFGGFEGLKIAAELFEGVKDAETFDPESSMEWMAENMPDVTRKLVDHIATNLVQEATNGALKRTFGRELSEDDVRNVQAYLATGAKNANEYAKYLNSDDIPESMKVDTQGNPLGAEQLDFMRQQQVQLKQTQKEIADLRRQLDSDKQSADSLKAQEAATNYMAEALAPIDTHLEELGLTKAYEGETSEFAQQRLMACKAIEALAMHFAGEDKGFQAMLKTAMGNAARASVSRIDATKATDHKRRLQTQMTRFANKASEFLAPLFSNIAENRKQQIAKAQSGKEEITTASTAIDPKETTRKNTDDPFDMNDIMSDVRRLTRR